jgi:hypothetical protein
MKKLTVLDYKNELNEADKSVKKVEDDIWSNTIEPDDTLEILTDVKFDSFKNFFYNMIGENSCQE